MVFKTLTNFSRYSSTKANPKHSFFDPSYIGQQKVAVFDGILGTSSRQSSSSTAHHLPHHSIAASSSGFIVLDPSFLHNNNNINDNDNSNDQQKDSRILLKKASHKVNKNGHVNVVVDSITNQFTTLTLRKSNTTHTKTIKIDRNGFINSNLKQRQISKQSVQSLANAKKPPATEAQKPITSATSAQPAEHEQQQQEQQQNVQETAVQHEQEQAETDDPLVTNFTAMKNCKSLGKNNEILAIYNHIKDMNLTPTVEMFNMVLESIPKRNNVKETIEENLTLLMNVYSDMLNNGIKPDQRAYSNVIMPLLNGSIRSFRNKDLTQVDQFFTIANELFNIAKKKQLNFDQELYEKLLVCYNLTKSSGIKVSEIAELMREKLGYHNILYYLGLINLCKHSKDHQRAIEIYSQFKSLATAELLQHRLQVYSSLIRTLISCNQVEPAAQILDQLILNIRSESGMQKNIQPLITSFIVGLAEIGLVRDSYETLIKFDSILWLPKLPVNSLMILVDKACDFSELDLAIKFWSFVAVRKDFDSNTVHSDNDLVSLFSGLSSVETKATYSKLMQICFMYGDKPQLVRLAKEMLLKDSLRLEVPLLQELLKFLFTNGLSGLALKIASNQGFKLDTNNKINSYLSSIIDIIPASYYPKLMSSSFYKAAIDDYSLLEDNIYGIYKTMNHIWAEQQNKRDMNISNDKLNYYYTVLFEELDDLNNFYVETPQEIKDFKHQVALHRI